MQYSRRPFPSCETAITILVLIAIGSMIQWDFSQGTSGNPPYITSLPHTMAGLILGILHVLQKILCGAGNVDSKPTHADGQDYYHNQQPQPQQQGFPPLQTSYPPQGVARPQQPQAWGGHQGANGYQQHAQPYKASNHANIQRPNYQGPGGLVGGSILGPHSKLVSPPLPHHAVPAHAFWYSP